MLRWGLGVVWGDGVGVFEGVQMYESLGLGSALCVLCGSDSKVTQGSCSVCMFLEGVQPEVASHACSTHKLISHAWQQLDVTQLRLDRRLLLGCCC